MNFVQKTFKVAAVATALSVGAMSAHAATVTHVTDTDITDAVASEATYNVNTFMDIFTYDQSFDAITVVDGNKAIFTFKNNTLKDWDLRAGQAASVNPDDAFSPAATFSWDGQAESLLDNGNIQISFAAGQERTLTITFGDQILAGSNVDVRISAVPLPAGVLLMGTALAGFGALRRRKKA